MTFAAQITRLSPRSTVVWAVPTSGYGHAADEQPLPFISVDGYELTPRFGGEPGQAGTDRSLLGLPFGVLAQSWPWRQRCFNLPRRRMNLYWREMFRSRTPPDKSLLFVDQLSFRPSPHGFEGSSPILFFRRTFTGGDHHLTVYDRVEFRMALHFACFSPVVLPLFDDWCVNQPGARWLDAPGIMLQRQGVQSSAAGLANVWTESIPDLEVRAGHVIKRRYTYRWDVQ